MPVCVWCMEVARLDGPRLLLPAGELSGVLDPEAPTIPIIGVPSALSRGSEFPERMLLLLPEKAWSGLGRRLGAVLFPVMRALCDRVAGRRRRCPDGVPESGVPAAAGGVDASMASMEEKLGAQMEAERPF